MFWLSYHHGPIMVIQNGSPVMAQRASNHSYGDVFNGSYSQFD